MSADVECETIILLEDQEEDVQDQDQKNPDCLLCGTRNFSSKIPSESQDKWTQHFCQLYSMDRVLLSEAELSEIQNTIRNGFYCIDCGLELESISRLYKTIEDIQSRLKVLQLQCEQKLQTSIEAVERENELRKSNSMNDCFWRCEINQQKKQLLKCMAAASASVASPNFVTQKTINLNPNHGHRNDDHTYFFQDDSSGRDDLMDMDSDNYDETTITPSTSNLLHSLQLHLHRGNENNPGTSSVTVFRSEKEHSSFYKSNSDQNIITKILPSIDVGTPENYDELKRRFKLKPLSVIVERIHTARIPIQKKRKPTKFHCTFPNCPSCFSTEARRDYHIKTVHEFKIKYPFPCQICPKRCESLKNYLDHQNVHLGLLPFECAEAGCLKKFATESGLLQHRKGKHDESPLRFQCEICGRAYKCISSLKGHRKIHAGENSKDKVKGPKSKPFKCETCEKAFSSRSILREHLLTHDESQLEALSCPICGRMFSRKDSLRVHEQRIHTKSFAFKCDLCDFGAADKWGVDQHVMSKHSDARSFSCDMCDHTFKIRAYLNRHKKLVHPASKDFVCSSCGKGFANKRYLQEHEETHKEIKSFLCPECGRTFTQKTSLKKHIGNIHGIKIEVKTEK